MVLQVKGLAGKADDLSLIPGAHMVGEKNNSQVVFLPPYMFCSTCMHTSTQTHTHKINAKNFF